MKIINVIKNRIKNYPKFYQSVWLTCLKIPKGEVRTYEWIAKKIGHPKAYRAVGNALAKNPLPGIIPCHRVIRKNGKIGGFTKGTLKKIKLLILEKLEVKTTTKTRKLKKHENAPQKTLKF